MSKDDKTQASKEGDANRVGPIAEVAEDLETLLGSGGFKGGPNKSDQKKKD